MVTSLVGGVSSASDHFGDGGVFAEELLLPISQVLLCLVIPEVEIVLSHEEQHISAPGWDAF